MSVEISVLVCTYKRPETLVVLLKALSTQRAETPAFEVCIVDNDQAGSAQEAVKTFSSSVSFPIHYQIEPEQNIAHARNRTIRLASGHWLAMIDDDEQPDESWLFTLYETANKLQADALFAPVLPGLPDCTPDWMREGGFHDRPRHATGTVIPENETRAGNVFIRAELFQTGEQPFDPAFGRSGGEDVRAFEAVRATGAKMLWCDEAAVTEALPPERVTLEYLKRRAFWGAQIYARLVMADYPRGTPVYYLNWWKLGVKSAAQWVVCAGMTIAHAPIDKIKFYRWQCKTSAQWGKLTALAGGVYIAYE